MEPGEGVLRGVGDSNDAGTAEHTLRQNKQPNKAFYRQRAHCNPLAHNKAYAYPVSPEVFDLTPIYPNITNPVINFLDVGCGYGGLTMELARLYPTKLVLGMEIRAKVAEYVKRRIEASRELYPGEYQNAGIWKTNSMKYLPNYIPKGTIEKIFICFPDPHFKGKKHRRRIVSDALLSEYAYVLAPNGLLHLITDVKELHEWHLQKCDAHAYFTRIPDEEIMSSDPAAQAMVTVTEEGQKVARNNGEKYYAVYRRIEDHELNPAPLLSLADYIPDL